MYALEDVCVCKESKRGRVKVVEASKSKRLRQINMIIERHDNKTSEFIGTRERQKRFLRELLLSLKKIDSLIGR